MSNTCPWLIRRQIVTRGDRLDKEMEIVEAPLNAFNNIDDDPYYPDVWNNLERPFDAKVFGRFIVDSDPTIAAKLLYTQDDDCRVPNWKDLIAHWGPGLIVCNMPANFQEAYRQRRTRLLGFGSIFEISLIRPTFDRYFKYFPMDDLFLIECDRIFTGLNTERCIMVDVGHDDMPYASDPSRLWKQKDHGARNARAELRVNIILEIEKDGPSPWADYGWREEPVTLNASPCCDVRVDFSRADGVSVGTCSKCGRYVARINPKTNKLEVAI